MRGSRWLDGRLSLIAMMTLAACSLMTLPAVGLERGDPHEEAHVIPRNPVDPRDKGAQHASGRQARARAAGTSHVDEQIIRHAAAFAAGYLRAALRHLPPSSPLFAATAQDVSRFRALADAAPAQTPRGSTPPHRDPPPA